MFPSNTRAASLSALLDQSKKALSTGASARAYADARSRHRAFAPYETVGAVLGATERGSALSPHERDAIHAAIVTELQESPAHLWQCLLLVSFTPMLVRIRASLRQPGNVDADQRVLIAFLEAARSPVSRSYVARNLRLLTQVRLFTERRRERRAPELLLFDEETHPCDPFRVEAHARVAAAEVVRIIEAEGGEELRDLLFTTYGDDTSVKTFVDHAYAACDERVRARASKRLRRARLEAFAKLRARSEGTRRSAPAA
jgi:hypothetical protein